MNSSALTYRVNNVIHDDVCSLLLAASQHVHQICHVRWRAVSVRNGMPWHIKAADCYHGHVLNSLLLEQALEHSEVMVIMDHKRVQLIVHMILHYLTPPAVTSAL